MKQYIRKISKHPLVVGSSIMILGSLGGNVLNFFFNIYMVRALSLADYGILASIISLITLPTLAAGAVIPTIVSFAGSYFAKNNIGQVSGLLFKISKYFLILGGITVILFSVFSYSLATFLQISNPMFIVVAGVIVFFGFMGAVNTGFLQAKLSFGFIVSANFLGAFFKLLFGIALVTLGYSVTGAISAIFISFFLPYALMFLPLKNLFDKQIERIHTPRVELISYGLPAAICVFSLTSFITSDILLVKHFFSPQEAGVYATLSLIGRIIFFITAPITSVMFPLIVQKHTKNEKYMHLFLVSLLFVIIPSSIITYFYFLFPNMVLTIFFKTGNPVSNIYLLGYFGVFISLYSIVALVTNFFLSTKRTYIALPLSIAAIGQICIICMFHTNFFQVIWYSSIILSLLLIVLLLYYFMIPSVQKHEKT